MFLKARLTAKGWDLEKTYSIRRLLALSEDHGLRYHLTDEDVAFIDSIYRGRYPAEAGLLPEGEPDADDAHRAVRLANELLRGSST